LAPTLFSEVAALSGSLEATSKRKEKTRLLAEFLKALEPGEVGPAVLLVVGSVFPEFDSRALDVGWRTVKGALKGGKQTTLFSEPLTVMRVYDTLERIAAAEGPGSRRVKTGLLQGLLNEADPGEVEVLVRIIFGEMRIGVNEGVMLMGIAEAAGVEPSSVRRALMMTGNLERVAEIAMESGSSGLEVVEMSLFTPLKPMLASMAEDVAEVIEAHGGESAFEFKLDGARIQIHRRGEEIRVFSRRLSDVTASLPDIVALVRDEVGSEDTVLEGEVVAVAPTFRYPVSGWRPCR